MDLSPRYVTDLPSWELPRADEFEVRLLKELTASTRASALTPEILGEELYAVFLNRLREIAGVVVNETIEYWLRGLTNGLNGKHPELCVEFPYVLHNENVSALTMDYCVDNQDGTRTRLLRTDLPSALTEYLKRIQRGTYVGHTTSTVIAAELRALAQQIDDGTLASEAH